MPLLSVDVARDPSHVGLPASDPGARRSAADAARQFEGVFVAMLLKQMRESVSGDGLIPSDRGDVLGGLFDQSLGDQIARGGGLGLAAALSRSLP